MIGVVKVREVGGAKVLSIPAQIYRLLEEGWGWKSGDRVLATMDGGLLTFRRVDVQDLEGLSEQD